MSKILKEIESYKNKEKSLLLARFFKTKEGEYGAGDIFYGITVPISRKIALKYKDISLNEIQKLLKSKVHEIRLISLFILIYKYKNSSLEGKKNLVDFYLKNTKYINNWDLVDSSASYILGDYLSDKKDKKILYKLANSGDLWQERIAIISTSAFIRNGNFEDTLKICKILINHKHDLIHKACGWMLREVGKKDEKELKNFLDRNISKMPRTMLRYAIEKFSEMERRWYLNR